MRCLVPPPKSCFKAAYTTRAQPLRELHFVSSWSTSAAMNRPTCQSRACTRQMPLCVLVFDSAYDTNSSRHLHDISASVLFAFRVVTCLCQHLRAFEGTALQSQYCHSDNTYFRLKLEVLYVRQGRNSIRIDNLNLHLT